MIIITLSDLPVETLCEYFVNKLHIQYTMHTLHYAYIALHITHIQLSYYKQ